MKIIGHRGACGYEHENTLSSFKKALELGVDAIELDVYHLESGELVIMHDSKVNRTTNGTGFVEDFTFTELRKLDAGNGQQVPTLHEVLDLVDARVQVNIELKGFGTAKPVAACISERIQNGWTVDHFSVSSFNHVELSTFNKLMPTVKIGALIDGIPLDYAAFASELNAYSVNPSAEFLSKDFVADAKARGLEVHVYTVNDEDLVRKMLELDVDAIFTNYPDRSRSIVQQHSQKKHSSQLS